MENYLASKRSVKCCSLSHVRLFATPWTVWTVAHQAPLSMAFSRQEYWSGLPFPPPGDLADLRIEPWSPSSGQILHHLSHISIVFQILFHYRLLQGTD